VRFVQAGTMLLGAVGYVLIIAFAGDLSSADHLHWNFFIIGYWNTLLIVVTALVVVDSVRKVRAGETRKLATDLLAVKLASIPFFLLNFFVLAYLAIGGAVLIVFGGFVLLIAVAIGSVLTYLTMLSTSIYAWAAIARLRRERVIGTGLTVLYMFLSFVFVTDIVAGVLLFGHSRRRPGLAVVVVLLSFGLILVVLGSQSFDPVAGRYFDLEWLIYVGVIGIALILATVVISLVRLFVVRRRTRQLSAAAAEVTEGSDPEGAITGADPRP
jgi:hypothetical protein